MAEDEDHRWMLRFKARASATILRDSDTMRLGLPAIVTDVSVGGLSLLTAERLAENEHVKLRLKNEIQRFDKETRGVVRRITESDGLYRIGVELFARLTPLEVSLMRSAIPPNEGTETAWV